MRPAAILGAIVLSFSTLTALPSQASAATTGTDSVHFVAAGDWAASTQTSSVLDATRGSGADLGLALGDFSYGKTGQEKSWCDYVKSKVGATFPFELISGNHESNGLNGTIGAFTSCLPNRLPGVTGTYGRQWYADVPASNPLVRFIMISPGLQFPDGYYSYAKGTPRYQWTANAIDSARATGVPWVVVGYHKPCLSMTAVSCSSGPDLMNLMASKKVDLVLSGHNHLYERTKQLALSGACPQLVPGTARSACVADGDDALVQGAGTVFGTVGTGGAGLQGPSTGDPERPYFAAWAGKGANPTWGLLDVTADRSRLSARFVPTSGGSFTDAFTITRPGGSGTGTVNEVPVARFSAACDAVACGFDGSASTDTDGHVTRWAWDFGDGATGTGRTASHDYAAAGTYPVALTVTDDTGATATTTHQVTVTLPDPPPAGTGQVGFVGADHSGAGAKGHEEVTVPAGASAGDVGLLFLTRNASRTWGAPTGMSGWSKVEEFTNGAITSTVWKKTLAGGDAGATVAVDAGSYTKGVLALAVYSGADPAKVTAATITHAGSKSTTRHLSAPVDLTGGQDVVTYWADKSSATTTWTAPSGVTRRDTATGTGKGRFASLVTDTDAPRPAGRYGPQTATTDATSSYDASWTIPLTPTGDTGGTGGTGGSVNEVPVARFSAACDAVACGFDGSASTDTDGHVTRWAWDFGDGATGTGRTASHDYAAAGTYPVALTVTDDTGATATTTHQVTVTLPDPPPAGTGQVGFVGADHSGAGAKGHEEVTVPAGASAGDVGLLFLTRNASRTWGAPTGMSGWSKVEEFTNGAITSTVWKKTLAGGDAGATVAVDAGSYTKGVLALAVYSGADPAKVTAATITHAGSKSTTRHLSAPVDLTGGQDVVTYWADKSSATTTWTAPSGVTRRDTATGTGKGRFASLVTDTDAPRPAGRYGPQTATTDATSSYDASWTIPLTPTS